MRIAIVNDMNLAVQSLRRIVESSGSHEVAWVARDGQEAVERCAEDRPELILMDLIMPVMNGAQAARKIMATNPCPIVVVTSSVEGNAALVFEAMGAGALDAVRTPILNEEGPEGAAGLLAKIATIGKLTSATTERRPMGEMTAPVDDGKGDGKLVAMGASTGGPKALADVLSHLPANFPASIVVIQHVDAQFAQELADWLDQQCRLRVSVAHDGDRPRPGHVLIAGSNDHLVLTKRRHLAYTPEPREQIYWPSVDVFFASAAARWKGDMAAVLLTGMGRDGGQGMRQLRDLGAHTIAEHQSTCAVYGMPKTAVLLQGAAEVLPVYDIAAALIKHFPAVADTTGDGTRGAAV